MINLHRTAFFVASVITMALMVFPVFAQINPIGGNVPCGFPGMACTGNETFSNIYLTIIVIVNVVLSFVGITAVIFIIYAGFKYITSRGDEEAAKSAKNQILYALIGVFITLAASLIVYTLVYFDPAPLLGVIGTIVYLILSFVGITAVIFIIYAGFKYITSRGDEEAAKSAKNQILYALIGIIVAATASLIVYVITGLNAAPLMGVIRSVVNTLLIFTSIATAIFIIIAGAFYITSQGDEEQAKRAKKQILYAILGLIVILISGVLVNLIISAV